MVENETTKEKVQRIDEGPSAEKSMISNVCFNCQKPGHMVKDCKALRPFNWKQDYKCYGCRKTGQ